MILILILAAAFGIDDPAMRPSTLNVGQIGYWRMEEATGTRYDASPNGNHLTAVNSPGQAAGIKGNCATFTYGSSQYLSIADNTSFNVTGSSFTVAGWCNLTTITNYMFVAGKANTASPYAWELYYSPVATKFVFNVYSNVTFVGLGAATFGSPTTNTWNFVAAGYDIPNNQIWISVNNGTADTTNCTLQVTTSANPLTLGTEDAQYGWGNLDEIGIWKRKLTASELSQLYNGGHAVTSGRFLR